MPAKVGRLLGNVGPQGLGEFPFQGKVVYYLFEQMDLLAEDLPAYLAVANPYVPEFEKKFQFRLIAGGTETVAKEPGHCRITHLWNMPEADSLETVMVGLCNDVQYGKIDALVGKTAFECQDIAINFGLTHGGPDNPPPSHEANFWYVLAQHQLWTTDINTFAWEFDFDASYYTFVNKNPGWIHLGNRMKITGSIYNVFELWMAPAVGNGADAAKENLASAPWNTNKAWRKKKTTYSVLTPIDYDNNLKGKG